MAFRWRADSYPRWRVDSGPRWRADSDPENGFRWRADSGPGNSIFAGCQIEALAGGQIVTLEMAFPWRVDGSPFLCSGY